MNENLNNTINELDNEGGANTNRSPAMTGMSKTQRWYAKRKNDPEFLKHRNELRQKSRIRNRRIEVSVPLQAGSEQTVLEFGNLVVKRLTKFGTKVLSTYETTHIRNRSGVNKDGAAFVGKLAIFGTSVASLGTKVLSTYEATNGQNNIGTNDDDDGSFLTDDEYNEDASVESTTEDSSLAQEKEDGELSDDTSKVSLVATSHCKKRQLEQNVSTIDLQRQLHGKEMENPGNPTTIRLESNDVTTIADKDTKKTVITTWRHNDKQQNKRRRPSFDPERGEWNESSMLPMSKRRRRSSGVEMEVSFSEKANSLANDFGIIIRFCQELLGSTFLTEFVAMVRHYRTGTGGDFTIRDLATLSKLPHPYVKDLSLLYHIVEAFGLHGNWVCYHLSHELRGMSLPASSVGSFSTLKQDMQSLEEDAESLYTSLEENHSAWYSVKTTLEKLKATQRSAEMQIKDLQKYGNLDSMSSAVYLTSDMSAFSSDLIEAVNEYHRRNWGHLENE